MSTAWKFASRILAVFLLLYVADVMSFVWRMWSNGFLGLLLRAGPAGHLLGWHRAVTFTAGPLAGVQLWRRHWSGWVAGIVVVVAGMTRDVGLTLLADTGSWLAEVPALTIKAALLSVFIFGLRAASKPDSGTSQPGASQEASASQ